MRVEAVSADPNKPVVGFCITDQKGNYSIKVKTFHFPSGEGPIDLNVRIGLASERALYEHNKPISVRQNKASKLTLNVPDQQATEIEITQRKLAALSELGADIVNYRRVINEVVSAQIGALAQMLISKVDKKQKTSAIEK